MSEPNKPESKGFFTPRSIVSFVVLMSLLLVLVLMLRKPRPVAQNLSPQQVANQALSFQTKVDELARAQVEGQPAPETRLTADEISAAIAQANPQVEAAITNLQAQPDARELPKVQGVPTVSFEGDLMKGQFLTELAGRNVYVTVEGRLGSKDGYATFEPTSFKIGDLSVPVSLVNDALQKKLGEQRDQLKLPDYISGIKVENGELVVVPKSN